MARSKQHRGAANGNSQRQRRARPASQEKPNWEEELGELWFQGQLVKQFRQPADDQKAICRAFQELNWKRSTFDPLSPKPGRERSDRLHDTVKHLNDHQINCLLHFRRDGTGKRIIWETRKEWEAGQRERAALKQPQSSPGRRKRRK